MSERVAQSRLNALARRAFVAARVTRAEAEAAAEVLVLAEMMGITTHGIARVAGYADRIAGGGTDLAARVSFAPVLPALIRADGANGLGPAVARLALARGIEVAKTQGVAAIFLRRANHFGAAAPYCYLAAQAGMACIITSNTAPLLAPAGGIAPRIGNAPLGLAIPDPGGRHVILDMALSVTSRSRVRRAAKAGESIPPDWAMDAEGQPTRDPQAALSGLLAAAGGIKGANLALLLDLFSGLLSGAAFLSQVPDLERQPGAEQGLGQMILLVNAGALLGQDMLAERLETARTIVHDTPPLDAENPVRLPGERALARLADCARDGIPVPEAVLADLIRRAGPD